MATFLDFSILRNFAGIFTWLLVWAVAFGLIEMFSPFGKDKKGIHAIIAVVLAFLVMFTSSARYMVESVVPWLTIIGIIVFFITFAMMAFGMKPESVVEWVSKGGFKVTILIVGILVVLISLGGAFGQPLLEQTQGGSTGETDTTYLDDYPDEMTGQDGYPSQVGGDGMDHSEFRSGNVGIDNRPVPRNKFAENIVMTFTHPKMLAVVFILILGMVTVIFLSKP